MNVPTVPEILAVMDGLGHRVFKNSTRGWNLNIVGIRNPTDSAKKFDDLLVVFHWVHRRWDVAVYPITTDPSAKYLARPINSKGTAILAPGQYRSAYSLDVHRRGTRGAHLALCQRNRHVSVFRDKNRDGKLNMDPATVQHGMFGINIHRGPRGGKYDPDNSVFSAGCQVFADDRHFDEFILKVKHGRAAFGPKFTYTLLDGGHFRSR